MQALLSGLLTAGTLWPGHLSAKGTGF